MVEVRGCCQFISASQGTQEAADDRCPQAQAIKRIQWTRRYARWSCKMWEKMMFSDERTSCRFGNQAHIHMYVHRFPGEEFKPENLDGETSSGPELDIVDGTVSMTKYTYILQKWHQHSCC